MDGPAVYKAALRRWAVVFQRVLRQAVPVYQAGGTVWFGAKLNLSQQGIGDGEKTLPWGEVAEVKLDEEYNHVTIRQAGEKRVWKYVSGSDVASPWEHRNSYYGANFGRRTQRGITVHDYDPDEAHSGSYSVRITAANKSGATLRGRIEQKVAKVGANKTYTFSAWVKASSEPTRVSLCLYGWEPNWGRDFEGGVSPEFMVGKKWKRIDWTRAFGPGITDVCAMVKREYQILGDDVWIDDVQMEEGAQTTDFVPDAWTETVQKTAIDGRER